MVITPYFDNRSNMQIKRDQYLNQLIAGRKNGLIKIITGIRRCGKSYLLFTLFHEYLNSQGVDEGHIIEIALDDRMNIALRNPDAILKHRNRKEEDGLFRESVQEGVSGRYTGAE